jgi:hypothetical protein
MDYLSPWVMIFFQAWSDEHQYQPVLIDSPLGIGIMIQNLVEPFFTEEFTVDASLRLATVAT